MLWKYFQNCMYSFRENWETNLRICLSVPRFNLLLFTISLKSKVLFQCRSEITWPTVYGSVTWFPFVWWGKVNRTGSSMKDFSLIDLVFFYICCNLSVVQNILPRQQIFCSEICFFISYILLVLQHLGICYCNVNVLNKILLILSCVF